ncbi:DUF5363 family protein [Vibrio cholerae O1]|nr:DUF5363 family protein [Vibrio cholerae O1]
MWLWLKRWIAKYDAWCQSMGLMPGQKRSCVPYFEPWRLLLFALKHQLGGC